MNTCILSVCMRFDAILLRDRERRWRGNVCRQDESFADHHRPPEGKRKTE